MAKLCPVCNKEIGFWQVDLGDVTVHAGCEARYLQDPEKYGGKAIEKTEDQIKAEVQRKEQQQKIEDQSVHVKSFDMPFGDMVGFIFKWTMASIPTAIFLAILFLIFTAIFAQTK